MTENNQPPHPKEPTAIQIVEKMKASRDKIRAKIEAISFKKPIFFALWILVFIAIIVIVSINNKAILLKWQFWILSPILCGIGSALLYVVVLAYIKMAFQMVLITYNRQLAGIDATKLQETLEDDFFNKLVKINFKYIDQYYSQTQGQADKSFILTAIVAGLGVAIIASGIILMYLDKIQPAYVTTAAGLFSEFIASVFFYLYNRTIVKMGEYHQKLVLTQNIGLALKISEGLPEIDKVEAQKMLIDRLSENVNLFLASQSTSPNNHSNKRGASA